MNEIAGEGYSIEFIDVDQEQNKATKYAVRSVPTVVIEENGIEVDRFVGSIPKQMILEKLL
jgi:thioredoxin 1